MQIHASLHSYEQTPRSPIYDRKPVTLDQSEDALIARRDDAITGSQTVLSNSLAEALWSIQRSTTEEDTGSTMESLYLAYSE
jgi:hypothetical protein